MDLAKILNSCNIYNIDFNFDKDFQKIQDRSNTIVIYNNQRIIGQKTYTIDGKEYKINIVEPIFRSFRTGYISVTEEEYERLRLLEKRQK